jgi:hypothetical protein
MGRAKHAAVVVLVMWWGLSALIGAQPVAAGPAVVAGGASALATPALATADPGQVFSHRAGPALWLAGAGGGVFPLGRAAYAGRPAPRATPGPSVIVAVAVTPTGQGYWLASAGGEVTALGDAPSAGGIQPLVVHAPVVAMAATPTGRGYWLAAADGGVFAFGDAAFRGGLAGVRLNGPVSAMAATPSGRGYWLAGADGGIYAFGDARLFGNAVAAHLRSAVVAMAATPTGNGYWVATGSGVVYAFGDAPALGAATRGVRPAPVVAMARTASGRGYWLASSDGRVSPVGDAEYLDGNGPHPSGPVVAVAAGTGVAVPPLPTSPASPAGFDISWPQCGRSYPNPSFGFGVVGVNGGRTFTPNPCLRDQWRWATAHGSFAGLYVNTGAFTDDQLATFLTTGARSCRGDVDCALYRWGRQGAAYALDLAGDLPAPMWLLDVETANHWTDDAEQNTAILQGFIDEFEAAGKHLGIYSTSHQWNEIVGRYAPGLPLWVAGGPDAGPAAYCAGHAFAGGRAWLVQALSGQFDSDVLCGPGAFAFASVFAPPAPLIVPEYPDPVAQAEQGLVLSRTVEALNRPEHAGFPPPPAAVAAPPRAHSTTGWGRPAWAWLLLAVLLFALLGMVGERQKSGPGRPLDDLHSPP